MPKKPQPTKPIDFVGIFNQRMKKIPPMVPAMRWGQSRIQIAKVAVANQYAARDSSECFLWILGFDQIPVGSYPHDFILDNLCNFLSMSRQSAGDKWTESSCYVFEDTEGQRYLMTTQNYFANEYKTAVAQSNKEDEFIYAPIRQMLICYNIHAILCDSDEMVNDCPRVFIGSDHSKKKIIAAQKDIDRMRRFMHIRDIATEAVLCPADIMKFYAMCEGSLKAGHAISDESLLASYLHQMKLDFG